MPTDIDHDLTDSATEALYDIVHRVELVWAENDADKMAEIFTKDATLLLPGDVYLKSREAIRAYFTAAYAGPMKGSRVAGRPVSTKRLSDDVSVVVTEGGVVYPGQTEVSADNAIRATWVVVKQGEDLLVTAYHNSRTAAPAPA